MKCGDKAEYRSFAGDGANWGAQYARYALSGVLLREKWASEPEKPEDGDTLLYFFPDESVCRDERGAQVPLPRAKAGDLVCLRQGTREERILRVRESFFCFESPGGGAAHVRLTLR